MTDDEFRNVDPEEVEDLLVKIAASFRNLFLTLYRPESTARS
jgi:hypothetical protein